MLIFLIKVVRIITKRFTWRAIFESNGSQSGFTLIEIIMVMAVSAALGSMVLFGQAEVRKRAQFSDGIEKTKNALMGVKNEANTTVNACFVPPGPCGSGGDDTSHIVVGKLAEFTDDSSVIQVSTLLARCQDIACNNIDVFLNKRDTYSINIPWGVFFDDSSSDADAIAFIRSPQDGDMTVYTPLETDNVLDSTIYSRDSGPRRRRVTLRFDDVNGYRASIFVNAQRLPGGGFDAGDGLITRSFN